MSYRDSVQFRTFRVLSLAKIARSTADVAAAPDPGDELVGDWHEPASIAAAIPVAHPVHHFRHVALPNVASPRVLKEPGPPRAEV